MTLEALSDLDAAFGWDGNQTDVADLKSILTELQNFTITVVSGTSPLTLTGIATTDTIIKALEVVPPWNSTSSGLIDRTSDVAISAADTITLASALSAGAQLVVYWFDKE